MFKQPSNSNAIARIALGAAIALLIFQMLAAAQVTRVELRCGAACQKINSGQTY